MLLTLHKSNTDLIKTKFNEEHTYLDNDEFLNTISYHLMMFHETPAKYMEENLLIRLYNLYDKYNYSRTEYENIVDLTTADLITTNIIYDLKDVSYIKIYNPIHFASFFVNFLFMYILNEYYELYNEDELGCYSYISEDVFLQVIYAINTIRYYKLINDDNWNFLLDVIINDLLYKITVSSEQYGLYYKNSIIVIEKNMTIEDYGINKKQGYIDQLKRIVNEEYVNYNYYNMKIRR